MRVKHVGLVFKDVRETCPARPQIGSGQELKASDRSCDVEGLCLGLWTPQAGGGGISIE